MDTEKGLKYSRFPCTLKRIMNICLSLGLKREKTGKVI